MLTDQRIWAYIAIFVFILLLPWGCNRFLRWMDEKDWILIPNRDAVKNADARLAQLLMEVQAYVEPAKRHVIAEKEAQRLKRETDDAGDKGTG